MALNFPDSPSNGDTHTANGIQYTYNSTATTWTDISGNVMFVADTSPTNPNSGDLWWNSSDLKLYVYYNDGTTSQWVANPFGPTGATGPAGTTGAAGTSQTPTLLVADMAALVAVTGMAAGDKALVTGLNKLFMYTGSAWYLIATMTNSSPTAITGANATYTLASDGTATTITLVSTDPEGGPLTWAQTVSVGNLNGTTISNVDNVFTVTPHASNATTFSLQFSATDMVSGIATVVSAFTLSFGFGGTLSYYAISPNQTVTSSGGFGTGVCCNETYSFFSTNHSGNTTHGHIYGYLNSNGTHTKTYNSTSSGAYILGTSNGIACNSTLLAAHEGTSSNGVQLFNIATGTLLHKFTYPTGSGIDNVSGAYWANNLSADMKGSRPISMSENYIAIGEMSRDVAGVTNGGSIYVYNFCLLYTSPSPRDGLLSRMPSSA